VFALVLALATSASADPASDYAAVRNDYMAHGGNITACKFTRTQLVNARSQITPDVDAYDPGFRDEVNTEIRRWDSGGCKGSGGGGGGGGSGPAGKADFRIVALKGKVRGRNKRREYVTIRNRGGKTGNLKGWSLRDRSGHRIRFRKSLRLKAHRRLRVVSGCAKRHRRAFRRGTRYYACRKSSIWNDRGDVAKLIDKNHKVVSQRGFGRFKSFARF
jgi:lamin tail-like protein